MSAPLPNALRTRFQRYIEEGLSGRAAAMRLKLSAATGAWWARLIRTRGHAHPAPQGRPLGRGKLAPFKAFFEELVTQDPDITLFELRTLWRWRKVSKFTIPPLPRCCHGSASPIKKSLVASERGRARVRQTRYNWLTRRLPAMRRQPERLVMRRPSRRTLPACVVALPAVSGSPWTRPSDTGTARHSSQD